MANGWGMNIEGQYANWAAVYLQWTWTQMCSQLLVSEPLWANLPFSCDFIERHR